MTNATEQDLINIKEIEDFLNTEGVEYTKREDRFDLTINNVDGTQGVWTLYHPVWSYAGENGQVTEVRYINSASHRIDCSKKWGKDYYGIPQNFFSKLSKEKEHLSLNDEMVNNKEDKSENNTSNSYFDKLKEILTEEEYEILVYRIVHEFNFIKIAKILNTSRETVRRRYNEIISKSKKYLGGNDNE